MKTGTLVAIIVGIVALFVAGAYLQDKYDLFAISVGDNTYGLSCSDALNNYYYGAQSGECISYALGANKYTYKNSPQTLYKVESIFESERYGPSGLQKTCKVTVSRDNTDCTISKSRFGDLECVNGYCDYVDAVDIPDNCNAGDCLTISDNSHVVCLSNGKYSGVLSGKCQALCNPVWICNGWSICSASYSQTRTCTDSKNCNDLTNKPATIQGCIITDCIPTWQVGVWGTCTNGMATRIVTDLNNCGTTSNMPATTQSCSDGNGDGDIFGDTTIWWVVGGILGLVVIVTLLGKK